MVSMLPVMGEVGKVQITGLSICSVEWAITSCMPNNFPGPTAAVPSLSVLKDKKMLKMSYLSRRMSSTLFPSRLYVW